MMIAVSRLKSLVCSTMTVLYGSTLNKIGLNQGACDEIIVLVELQGLVAARPLLRGAEDSGLFELKRGALRLVS